MSPIQSRISWGCVTDNRVDTFYTTTLTDDASGSIVQTVSEAGVLSGTIATIPNSASGFEKFTAIGLSPDEQTLYFVAEYDAMNGSKVHAWDLATDTTLPTL